METVIENYKDIKKNDVKFITIAEWDAMGRKGCVELLSLTNNKLVYYIGNENIYDGEKIMDIDELFQIFSEFKNIRLLIEECEGLPDSWKHVYLGMGNHLFVASDVYDYFKALVDYLPSESHPYQIWMPCALMTLMLLDEGFTDKEKLLEKIKEISLKQNPGEIPIIEVWINYIHCSDKYKKNFEQVSLDKIDNPRYLEKQRELANKKTQHSILIFKLKIILGIIAVAVLMYILFIR